MILKRPLSVRGGLFICTPAIFLLIFSPSLLSAADYFKSGGFQSEIGPGRLVFHGRKDKGFIRGSVTLVYPAWQNTERISAAFLEGAGVAIQRRKDFQWQGETFRSYAMTNKQKELNCLESLTSGNLFVQICHAGAESSWWQSATTAALKPSTDFFAETEIEFKNGKIRLPPGFLQTDRKEDRYFFMDPSGLAESEMFSENPRSSEMTALGKGLHKKSLREVLTKKHGFSFEFERGKPESAYCIGLKKEGSGSLFCNGYPDTKTRINWIFHYSPEYIHGEQLADFVIATMTDWHWKQK